jgi:hypothetical protein
MTRKLAALLVLASLAALAFGAATAGATSLHQTQWDVSLEGKQTLKWSFAAERPEECTSYYGSPSQEAQGSGSIDISFATKKKRPLWAETYLTGSGKLRFSSFSTDGWSVPTVWVKRGKFSTSHGMPCGSDPDDPVPVPTFSDDSGCGRKKVELNPSLSWSDGKFVLLGSMGGAYSEDCPGPFESAMLVGFADECPPRDQESGLEGLKIQELHTAIPASEFLSGKAFDITANHTYRCEFPSGWPDEPPLKIEIAVRYEVSFKPRKG